MHAESGKKDDTDTEYAIQEAIRRGAMEIVVIGATGTRSDHVLGNIQSAWYWSGGTDKDQPGR